MNGYRPSEEVRRRSDESPHAPMYHTAGCGAGSPYAAQPFSKAYEKQEPEHSETKPNNVSKRHDRGLGPTQARRIDSFFLRRKSLRSWRTEALAQSSGVLNQRRNERSNEKRSVLANGLLSLAYRYEMSTPMML